MNPLAPTLSDPQDDADDGGDKEDEYDNPKPVLSVLRSGHQRGADYSEHGGLSGEKVADNRLDSPLVLSL